MQRCSISISRTFNPLSVKAERIYVQDQPSGFIAPGARNMFGLLHFFSKVKRKKKKTLNLFDAYYNKDGGGGGEVGTVMSANVFSTFFFFSGNLKISHWVLL